MSTLSEPQPVDPTWIPTPLYRMSVEKYEALVQSGVFATHDRFHLINGYLVAKMTQNTPHVTADDLCGAELNRAIPAGWYVRAAKPLRLPAEASEPEPDRCVVRGGIRDYADHHPGPADVALVVEVSEASLADDRKMAQVYGNAGIPIYWIINLIDGHVEVYSNPVPAGYAAMEVLMPGHVLPVVIDGIEVGHIPVADILP
jgi:Uma2 family endonuclease